MGTISAVDPNAELILDENGVDLRTAGKDVAAAAYGFPLIDDVDLEDMLEFVDNNSSVRAIGSGNIDQCLEEARKIFAFVTRLFAYLSCPDPDIQKMMCLPRTKKHETSIIRSIVDQDYMGDANRYSYIDVGKKFDERIIADGGDVNNYSATFKRWKVRTHIRQQWFGTKTDKDGNPRLGEEQRPIRIEEHEAGDGLAPLTSSTKIV